MKTSVSIYDFSRKHLAEALYGEATPSALRRIDAYLDGETKMTVDTLYVLFKQEPLLDLELSLRDIYSRYEVARYKKNMAKRNKKNVEFMSRGQLDEAKALKQTKRERQHDEERYKPWLDTEEDDPETDPGDLLQESS